MKRKATAKLTLKRDTIRTLQNADLANVHGGASGPRNTGGCSDSCSCDTYMDTTCRAGGRVTGYTDCYY